MVSYSESLRLLGANDELFDSRIVWMSSEEAARYLRKTVGALRTAVCRGYIKARKWRRRLYFRKSELDKMLETSEKLGGL